MIEKLKKTINGLKEDKLYTTEEIHGMGIVIDTKLHPSVFTLYRLIKSGRLPAINLSYKDRPRYAIRGNDLKKYLKGVYKI